MTERLPAEAVAALARGETIEAIRLTRTATGLDLKASKELVDRYVAGAAQADTRTGFAQPIGITSTSGGSLPHDAHVALERGDVIEAIKLTREATGLGLKESKQLVDAAQGRTARDGAVPGLASEGALFDPRHEPGRVRGGLRGGWPVLLALVVIALLAWSWLK